MKYYNSWKNCYKIINNNKYIYVNLALGVFSKFYICNICLLTIKK